MVKPIETFYLSYQAKVKEQTATYSHHPLLAFALSPIHGEPAKLRCNPPTLRLKVTVLRMWASQVAAPSRHL